MTPGQRIKVIAAAILAVPVSWLLGGLAAELLAGPDVGQLPALTIVAAFVPTLGFALWPGIAPGQRLRVMLGALVLLAAIALVLGMRHAG